MATIETIDAQCFLSYHRPDNETYDGVVDRLKAELGGRFAAESGRELRIFVDRDDIPGGGDWREKIAQSIGAATIFIPVVTMRYFQSQACREELLAFYDGAKDLGVTELILPVILAGRDRIRQDDPRPEVRIIERLNYRPIDEAVEAGYQSPQWKTAMRTLVTDVATALERAEEAIAGQNMPAAKANSTTPRGDSVAATSSGGDSLAVEDGSVANDDVEVFGLNEDLEELTTLADSTGAAIASFGDAVGGQKSAIDRLPDVAPNEQRKILISLAAAIRDDANRLGESGAELETKAREVDAKLRGLVSELSRTQGELADAFLQQLVGPLRGLSAGDSGEQLDEMVNMLSAVAVLNVQLRRALQPAIRGVRASRNVISIAESWQALASSGR